MKMLVAGLVGWARMDAGRDEQLKRIDTALTMLATMLAAVTLVICWP